MLLTLLSYPTLVIAFLVHHTPQGIRRIWAKLFGILWFDILRIRRDIILSNLQKAFPEKSESERYQIAREYLVVQALNLIEYFDFPFLSEKHKSKFGLHGREHLDNALKKGKGVCMLTLHLGNPDLGIAALMLYGYPISVISKEMSMKLINDFWFRLRGRLGTEYIPPRNSSFAVLKGLKRNRVVAFVMDQFMGPPIGCKVKFFGIETGAAMGCAAMTARSGAPVIPAYCIRRPEGGLDIYFEPEIPYLRTENADQDLKDNTQVYQSWIESAVRKQPEQWMWLHRRWKTFRG